MQPSNIDRARSLAHLDLAPRRRAPSAGRVAAATVISVGVSIFADALLVVVGTALFPSTKGYVHFRFSDYSKLTVIGVIVACLAWPVVTRLTSTPRWVFFRLAVLVSAVLLLPDLAILARGEPWNAVVVLVAMHLAIALITYNVLIRVARTSPARVRRPAPQQERVH